MKSHKTQRRDVCLQAFRKMYFKKTKIKLAIIQLIMFGVTVDVIKI